MQRLLDADEEEFVTIPGPTRAELSLCSWLVGSSHLAARDKPGRLARVAEHFVRSRGAS